MFPCCYVLVFLLRLRRTIAAIATMTIITTTAAALIRLELGAPAADDVVVVTMVDGDR